MSSLAADIPSRFMLPSAKFALISYLVGLGLPQRVARATLQAWAEALGVELTSTDYELINNKLQPTPVQPVP